MRRTGERLQRYILVSASSLYFQNISPLAIKCLFPLHHFEASVTNYYKFVKGFKVQQSKIVLQNLLLFVTFMLHQTTLGRMKWFNSRNQGRKRSSIKTSLTWMLRKLKQQLKGLAQLTWAQEIMLHGGLKARGNEGNNGMKVVYMIMFFQKLQMPQRF